MQSRWLQLDAGRLHYLDEGPRDAPALLLLHGNPTWCYHYRHLIAALRETYRVIAIDHLGCGRSDKPAGFAYTLEAHGENLARLIEKLELSNFVLGVHDWGGAIGMTYAVAHPESVRGLVLFNTAAFYLPHCPLRIRICRLPGIGALLVRGLNAFARGALRFATKRPERFPRAVRRAYLAPYDTWAHRIALHRFIVDIPLESTHPTRPVLDRIEAGLAGLRDHPALILWGAQDFCFTGRFLERWQSLLPNAETHQFAAAGHYVVEDASDEVITRVKTFLRRVTGSGSGA